MTISEIKVYKNSLGPYNLKYRIYDFRLWKELIFCVILASFCIIPSFLTDSMASSQKRFDCIPNMACFFPGDYLKYNETVGGIPNLYLNFTYQASFGKNSIMIDVWQMDRSKAVYTCSISVSTCGNPNHRFFQSFLNSGIWSDRYEIIDTTPINASHWIHWSLTNSTYQYNGNSRQVLFASYENSRYIIDKETGIVLYYQTGSPQLLATQQTLTLVDTNIIPSLISGKKILTSNNMTNSTIGEVNNGSSPNSNNSSNFFQSPVPISNTPLPNQNRSNCTPNLVCFFPGDYLKYNETVDDKPFLYTNFAYHIGIDKNIAMFDEWDYSAKNELECNPGETCGIPSHLYLNAFLSSGVFGDRFKVMEPIPIDTSHWIQSGWSLSNDTYDYNGTSRQGLTATLGNTQYIVDKQTGVILYYQSGNPQIKNSVQKMTLVSNNIFSSPNAGQLLPTEKQVSQLPNSTKPLQTIYKDDAHNFSFYPPAGWTQGIPTGNQLAFFTKFTSDTSATLGIYFTNTGKPISDSTLNSTNSNVLDTFVNAALFNNTNHQYNITSKTIEKFPYGYKIKVIMENIPQGNTEFEEAYYWFKDGSIYNLLLVSEIDGFNQNSAEFDSAVDSLYVGSSGSLMKPISKQLIQPWIKNNAKWWSRNEITDSEFLSAMQYLIQKNIMIIPATPQSSNDPSIPSWVRTSAGAWGTNQISDIQFIEDMKYLIRNGIIIIS